MSQAQGPQVDSDAHQPSTKAALIAITPAHNEAAHLSALGESLARQTVSPLLWVLVDDGSTDGTGAIADELAEQHDFIHVIHRSRSEGRRLSAKAEAVSVGYSEAIGLYPDAEFVASIDADVELPSNAFERVVAEFNRDPELGVTGGIYHQLVNGKVQTGWVSSTHVPGAFQVFRQEVFAAIGGYQPLRDGGLDVVSTAHARMLGWDTRAIPDLNFTHNRPMGSGGDRRPLSAQYHLGIRDYSYGTPLVFEVARVVRRLFAPPPVVGAIVRLAGYFRAAVTRRESLVPPDIAAFIRAEQTGRLTRWLPGSKLVGRGRA
jgi:glycosyltransferase involved in cell wall biosynthesis